ncbi:MAG: ABC transporter ATP-binding protein [Candidatus Hydrogenedentes bacterium]|nr:ABC transporter ATP-binding protein [Candidatus Hydrogenedentota bacterium]
MRRLLQYLRPFKTYMVFATLLLVGATVLSSAVPALSKIALDTYIADPSSAPATSGMPLDIASARVRNEHGLAALTALIVGLMVAEGLVRYLQMLLVAYVGQKTMLEMRVGVFSHLQRMSLRFLDKNPVGRLMTRVTSDVENIQETIVNGVVQVLSDLFTIVGVLGFMLWMNWPLALLTLTTVPLVYLTSLIFRKYARKSYLDIRKKIARVNAFLQENVTGMRVVQLFGREQQNYEEYERRNADHRDEWIRQVRNYAYYFPTVDFLGSLAIALIILFGGYQILRATQQGTGLASVGMLFAFVQYSDRIFGPIRGLADKYNLLQAAMASSERVFQLLDTPEDVADKPDAVPCSHLEGRVEFKNVWFAYESEQWVLKDINLRIEPGERIAIVGHTGAGKSTFISLLSRFYDVQRGAILADGVDVCDYEQESLRKNIGVVLQDVFLFSGSIERNIRLGDETMTDEHVRACARYVNAAGFIEKRPEGYDYDVGERGGNLSTGQRQLLAFARTLAHNPRILVLDEATSSVDTETEALIQDAIAKLMEGRTCIVIAHRLSTVQHADRIVVVHHGEIREIGTHQELLVKRGLYYTLYQLQYQDQA